MRLAIGISAAPLLGFIHGATAARAEAHTYGCVKYNGKPNSPIEFKFTVGSSSDNCMENKGHDGSVTVNAAGLFCADLGYVKEGCSVQNSIWGLRYSGGAYSGSTLSRWSGGWWNNDVWLKDSVPKTVVCPSQSECDSTHVQWNEGTKGPIYFIFYPGAQKTPKEPARDEL